MSCLTIVGFSLSAMIGCIYGYILRGKEIRDTENRAGDPEL